MKTSDFDYFLPPETIAQTPAEPRDSSRLLVLERATGQIEHKHFNQISEYVADPKREFDGLRHGFLELKVQVFLRGPELVIEPRPSSAKTPAPRKTAAPRKRKSV